MKCAFSLTDKNILITGASSGIGKSIAIECAGMGANLFITGRNKEKLDETFSLLKGKGHLSIVADLNKEDGIEKICNGIKSLDGIVHCAGIMKHSLCKDIEEEDFLIMDTNFKAPVMLQKHLLGYKKIKKEASVVFIASLAAKSPSVGNAMYNASKGALISYSKVLALELAPRKIRVNCICPAMVLTDLITSDGCINKDDIKSMQLEYPLKRYGDPKDIAYLAVYLLSDTSEWMTGSCIDITGGSK